MKVTKESFRDLFRADQQNEINKDFRSTFNEKNESSMRVLSFLSMYCGYNAKNEGKTDFDRGVFEGRRQTFLEMKGRAIALPAREK